MQNLNLSLSVAMEPCVITVSTLQINLIVVNGYIVKILYLLLEAFFITRIRRLQPFTLGKLNNFINFATST